MPSFRAALARWPRALPLAAATVIATAGLRAYGEEFWADLLAHPPLEMLRCRS